MPPPRNSRAGRSATIHDVANAAGTSIATVSRAFHMPEMVRPQTRERILHAAEQLGYTPNRAARGLITGRTGNLGLVVPDIANPFFPALVKAAQAQARAGNYAVFLADTDESPHTEERVIRAMAKQVDGVIACSSRIAADTLRELADIASVVLINRQVEGVPSVLIDMEPGMRQVVEHLYALGHRRCTYLAGPARSWSNRQRQKALRAAARQLGMEAIVLGPFEPTYEGGLRAADLAVAESPTAIVAYNDLMALGAMARLWARGISVPDDMSVTGFDDVEMARVGSTALTTVASPAAAAGRAAVDLLVGALSGPHAQASERWGLTTELLVRDTTAPPPTSRSGNKRAATPAAAIKEE